MEWEVVIGLEIHVQLSTKTKIFSGASTAFGSEPNTQACAVDLALPGTLPVFNENALRMAVMFGLAVNAEIGKRSVFERKNYFYPDLPKGYQTTQLAEPIVGPGFVDIETDDGVKVGATYEASDEGIVSTSSFISEIGESAEVRAETYRESLGWYDAIVEDMFA